MPLAPPPPPPLLASIINPLVTLDTTERPVSLALPPPACVFSYLLIRVPMLQLGYLMRLRISRVDSFLVRQSSLLNEGFYIIF